MRRIYACWRLGSCVFGARAPAKVFRPTCAALLAVFAASTTVFPVAPGGAAAMMAGSPSPQTLPEVPTVENFDGLATTAPYQFGVHVVAPVRTPPPQIIEDPPGNRRLRLATYVPPIQNNSIDFDRTSAGYACRVEADFDVRMTLAPDKGRADGMGFALLNTARYGTEGVVAPQPPLFAAEEPNFLGSLGLGFDIHRSTGESSNNHLSVHFNGAPVTEIGLFPLGLDLASGTWIHTKAVLILGATQSRLFVTLTPQGGGPIAAVTDLTVPGLVPYEARVQFGGRSGGESANHDLDNVNVGFTRCGSGAEGSATTLGQWSGIHELGEIPIHAHLLPNGKILYWDRTDYTTAGTPYDSASDGVPRLWNPASPATPPVKLANPGYDLFCTGHTFLADGRLLAVGGHTPYRDQEGLAKTSAFDPVTNSWAALPDMNAGRWYPTATALGNGDVLTVEGTHRDGSNIVHNTLPQVLRRVSGQWSDLTSARLTLGFYPFMYMSPNGRVFNAGPEPQTRYLDTSGTGSWTDVATSAYGFRDHGSSVLYGDGKVMIVGGSRDRDNEVPTNTAETIDLNAPSPQWMPASPLAYRRRHHTATILADGTVMVSGGTTRPGMTNASGSVLMPELWNPETGTWSLMAQMQVPRLYHSSALLLPDGRVFSGGGGHPRDSQNNDPDHPNAQIYSPPYLFKGPRPQITSAPVAVTYGQQFTVGTPDAANIQKVTWIALGSDTHSFNESQRINRLSFSRAASSVQVTAPTDPNLTPPGYYMLFVLNGNGVPSVSRIIRIDGRMAPADFDASTITDFAVFRPSNGVWFILGGTGTGWGTRGDVPVPGDYDANGRTDIAVFRPSLGLWFVKDQPGAGWGTTGDVPVPGDYDRDGDHDMAVFRPSNGVWFIRGGTGAAWGMNGDIPVPGDYDGDGDTDIAVFRPSTGVWFIKDQRAVAWGTLGDVPVPGDYDGDGDTDIAVFRPSNGAWSILGGTGTAWGTSGDIPVPGDYDGNRSTDVAVFRPSNGLWYIKDHGGAGWGTSGDFALPLPAAIQNAMSDHI